MLREPGAKLLYSTTSQTTSQMAINCLLWVVRKHSLHCAAAGTAPRQVLIQPVYGGTGINTGSGAFLFGFLLCGNDRMLFALRSTPDLSVRRQ
jgi:hypothetical protein